VPALPAAGPGEAVGQNAAFQIPTELPLHILPQALRVVAGERHVGLQMALHRAVQWCVLGAASAVDGAPGRSLDREVHATVASGS